MGCFSGFYLYFCLHHDTCFQNAAFPAPLPQEQEQQTAHLLYTLVLIGLTAILAFSFVFFRKSYTRCQEFGVSKEALSRPSDVKRRFLGSNKNAGARSSAPAAHIEEGER